MPVTLNSNGKHIFAPGNLFLKKPVESPKDYLDAALEAEKTISHHAVESESEIYWKDNPGDKIDVSFGYGAKEILFCRTGKLPCDCKKSFRLKKGGQRNQRDS